MTTLGILSCVWQRPERLSYTLDQLAAQDYDDWHLYLINNNPELEKLVKKTIKKYDIPMTVIHNATNHGPFARWEVASQYIDEHEYFMTLDDDVNFKEDLLSSWSAQFSDEVMGWNGFKFQSDYWHREQVGPYEACHYVWGSNMVVPADVLRDPRILELDKQYVQCDDLWVCYVANHLQGVGIRRGNVYCYINQDGKDTYPGQHRHKVLFLESLRREGWRV